MWTPLTATARAWMGPSLPTKIVQISCTGLTLLVQQSGKFVAADRRTCHAWPHGWALCLRSLTCCSADSATACTCGCRLPHPPHNIVNLLDSEAHVGSAWSSFVAEPLTRLAHVSHHSAQWAQQPRSELIEEATRYYLQQQQHAPPGPVTIRSRRARHVRPVMRPESTAAPPSSTSTKRKSVSDCVGMQVACSRVTSSLFTPICCLCGPSQVATAQLLGVLPGLCTVSGSRCGSACTAWDATWRAGSRGCASGRCRRSSGNA